MSSTSSALLLVGMTARYPVGYTAGGTGAVTPGAAGKPGLAGGGGAGGGVSSSG